MVEIKSICCGTVICSGSTARAAVLAAVYEGISLAYADLRGIDLSYAYLCEVDLRHARLENANLNCVLLDKADLSHATLEGVSITNASVIDTNLFGTRIHGANWYGTDRSMLLSLNQDLDVDSGIRVEENMARWARRTLQAIDRASVHGTGVDGCFTFSLDSIRGGGNG